MSNALISQKYHLFYFIDLMTNNNEQNALVLGLAFINMTINIV
jgi:hypothetical protein